MPNLDLARELLNDPRYPRTCRYDAAWQVENDCGCPTLWLLESLTNDMHLTPGMRVLDLGCGHAVGSIFLAREFGVQVWAMDLWTHPWENYRRIQEAGLTDSVYPFRADAQQMPLPPRFFDAVVAVNSLQYFGTDDNFLPRCLLPVAKPGAELGIVAPGFLREVDDDFPHNVPQNLLTPWARHGHFSWHGADWWRRHWQRSNMVDVLLADNFPEGEGYATYLRWEQIIEYDERVAADDDGRNITFIRLLARKRP